MRTTKKKLSHVDTEVKKIMAIVCYCGLIFFIWGLFYFSEVNFSDSNLIEHLCMNLEDSQSLSLDGLWPLPAGIVRMTMLCYHSAI